MQRVKAGHFRVAGAFSGNRGGGDAVAQLIAFNHRLAGAGQIVGQAVAVNQNPIGRSRQLRGEGGDRPRHGQQAGA